MDRTQRILEIVEQKSVQWNAFLSRNRLDADDMGLMHTIHGIRLFLLLPMLAAANGQEFEQVWPVGGPWVADQ